MAEKPEEIIAHELDDEHERTKDVRIRENYPFQKMILSDPVKKGLEKSGFVYPTIIQSKAIPAGKTGVDLILQSKSGTGKTLIFATILLERLAENPSKEPHPESLIIAPTREIAVQIEDILKKVGFYIPSFKVVSVIGGLDVTEDRKKIQGSKCIVGTPGRILHLIHNKVINLSNISLLILDEADKLLSFKEIDEIRSHLPTKKQIISCSATFSPDLDKMLSKIMKNPLFISTAKRATVLLGIKQFIYQIEEESTKTSILEMAAKVEALKNIFNKISFKQSIIFTNSQSRAESYKTYLDKEGWSSEVITGAMDQPARLEVFKKFRSFQTKILVTTDLMSRGVDSEHLNLVVNLDLPENEATYLHRIGRAGRFGSQGISITIISSKKDEDKLKRLLNAISNGMRVLTFPKENEEKEGMNFWELRDEEEQSLEYSLAEVHDVTLEKSPPAQEDINVNTQTYNIIAPSDSISEHMLEFTMDRNDNLSPSLLQQLHPISSNTIDDASSIAVDSEILKSQVDAQNVLDLLIDPPKELGRKKKVVDIFDDYKNVVNNGNEIESSSEEDTCEPTDSNSLIISNVKKLLIDNSKKPIKKDIFSEYENLHDSLSTSQNIMVPDNNDSSDADAESSTSQDEYEVNNEEGGEEEEEVHSNSTVSSGFDERTTSAGSSGIETSDDEDAGIGEEEELSEESTDDDLEEVSSHEEESSSEEEEVNPHNQLSHSSSRSYDPAFEMWQNLYWNQFNMIQNYVRFSSQI
ncbi:DDX20 family protein [Megaselia abdita]